MIEETNRNVQLTMAVQSLQGRLTAMERSANALRELLRQKFGDQGVVHLIEALENLGAGSNALLEVPSSSSTAVSVAENKMGFSYESKQPDSGGGGGGGGISPRGAAAAAKIGAMGGGGGGGIPSAATSALLAGMSSKAQKYNSSATGRVGGASDHDDHHDDESDPTFAYSKAIEAALYR